MYLLSLYTDRFHLVLLVNMQYSDERAHGNDIAYSIIYEYKNNIGSVYLQLLQHNIRHSQFVIQVFNYVFPRATATEKQLVERQV